MPYHDLSYLVETDMPVYPGDPAVTVDRHATHADDGYRTSTLSTPCHAGTHVDAPAHTEPDGATIAELPLDHFEAAAYRVDCTDHDARDPITVADLPAPATVRDADCLVVHTGWDAHWGTDRYRDHPYLAPDAAAWLADHDLGLALDTYGPDPTPSPNATDDEPPAFAAHHHLLGDGTLLVENVRGLAAVPDRFTLQAFPLKLVDGDGSPARAVAKVD
jgi:kynurenine formamidase